MPILLQFHSRVHSVDVSFYYVFSVYLALSTLFNNFIPLSSSLVMGFVWVVLNPLGSATAFGCTNNLHWRHSSFIHSVFCLTTGPKPPLKRFLHIVRSRASSSKWEYPLLSLRSYSSFLRLLPCLLVTSISPFIFPSITCFGRLFLCKEISCEKSH